jgi:putative endonuclease
MEITTYILKGRKDFYYCGITKNIAKRIIQHNCGMNKSTRNYRPLVIIFTRNFTNRMQARLLEEKIKNEGVKKWYHRNVIFGKN